MGNIDERVMGGDGLKYLWSQLKAILDGKASISSIPTKFSQLTNDQGFYSPSSPPPYPVSSVNGKTGAVTIAVPSSAADVGLGNVDNVKQYSVSNPPPYPVTSVNGKTGAVTIDIPVAEEEIFWAVVDETTNAEMEAAYEAGKVLCLKYEGVVYTTFTRYSATAHVFSYVHEAGLLQVGCMNDSWTDVGTRFLNMTEFTEMHNALADRVGSLEEIGESGEVAPHSHDIAAITNLQTTLDAKAAKADIAATKMAGFSNSAAIYVKISDFGAWGTGNWTQKGFSMLLTSRGGEMVWLALAADDSNTNAKAIRLLNTYSKITNLYYVASESSIYAKMNAWCNNICAHVISNVNGDYVPAVAQASALPSGAVEIKITEFGATSAGVTVGGSNGALSLAGSGDRPTYNGTNVALQSDIPSLSSYATQSWVQSQISAIAVYNGSVS